MSLVLDVGPYPYVMSMFHSRKHRDREKALDLVTSTQVLRPGDCYVFDPTVPHSAVPGRLTNDALLVLIQAEIDMQTPASLESILKRFPRHAQDRDRRDVFDPVLGHLEE